jgi:hypothetical protein
MLWNVEEEKDVFDDLLKERVIVNGQFTIDVRGLPILIHSVYIILTIKSRVEKGNKLVDNRLIDLY